MKSNKPNTWKLFRMKWISFLGKFIIPLITLFLGLSISLLPEEIKELELTQNISFVLITICVVFSIMILIYVALAIYDRLETSGTLIKGFIESMLVFDPGHRKSLEDLLDGFDGILRETTTKEIGINGFGI